MFVVFDIGNVLLRWDPRILARRLIADPERVEHFMATACGPDHLAAFDRTDDCGAVTDARAATFPDFAAELRAFNERWLETIDGPIAENVALLARLKAVGRPVYALTNFAADKFEQSRPLWPFLDSFDVAVVSGREGTIKPEPAIFEILLARTGRAAGQLLFIDDSAANVAAARAAGIETIQYAPGLDLGGALRARGIAGA